MWPCPLVGNKSLTLVLTPGCLLCFAVTPHCPPCSHHPVGCGLGWPRGLCPVRSLLPVSTTTCLRGMELGRGAGCSATHRPSLCAFPRGLGPVVSQLRLSPQVVRPVGAQWGSNWGVNSRPGGALAPMSGGLCWQGHESPIFGAVSAGAGVLSRLTRPQCRLHLHQGACWALASTSTARRAPRAPCPSQLLPTPLLNRLR